MSLEDLFSKLAMTTVTTVSRIAINHATNAAIRNVSAYIMQQPKDTKKSTELKHLQRRLDLKIKNLKPTIDIIARAVADGHSDLAPALEMCNDLKAEIDEFASAALEKQTTEDYIQARLKQLINNVDDCIPSLHLALRALEAAGGQKQPVSNSKLLQASAILQNTVSVVFYVRLYSLFSANVRQGKTAFTWKEEYHKCHLEFERSTDTFDHRVVVKEDLDDGRYHEEDESHSIVIPVKDLKRMFYTRSGELLQIEDSKTPVLVLKVQKHAKESGPIDTAKEEKPGEIGQSELEHAHWYAFELYNDEDSDEDEEDEKTDNKGKTEETKSSIPKKNSDNLFPTSLLLLETVLKLSHLEVSEQMNHLTASNELIQLYVG